MPGAAFKASRVMPASHIRGRKLSAWFRAAGVPVQATELLLKFQELAAAGISKRADDEYARNAPLPSSRIIAAPRLDYRSHQIQGWRLAMVDLKQIEQGTESRIELLLRLNVWAFGDRQFEVAYHILTAAMLSAVELKDPVRLRAIEKRAAEQAEWLEADARAVPVSSTSAAGRGSLMLFHTLVHDARHREALLRNGQMKWTPLYQAEDDQP